MVGEIFEVIGDLIGAAISVGGKGAAWLLLIAVAIIAVAIIVVCSEENACTKKGGTIVEIHGASTCVAKDSLKKI